MRKLVFIVALYGSVALLPCLSVAAPPKTLVNLNTTGVAIQGYDPVAFFTDNKPVKGSPQWSTKHGGATYYFSSAEHKASFDQEPTKYEPLFGGYCAYGVSRNKLVEIDVEAFQIMDGKLVLQYSKGVRNEFNKDQAGNFMRAQHNWPELLEKKGK